jgi:hypothetical protein
MSQQTESSPTPRFSKVVIPLLKEYTERLDRLSQQAREIVDRIQVEGRTEIQELLRVEFDALQQRVVGLQSASQRLSRTVSQRIEHAPMDDEDRLRLALRLADFESALTSSTTLMGRLMSYAYTRKN